MVRQVTLDTIGRRLDPLVLRGESSVIEFYLNPGAQSLESRRSDAAHLEQVVHVVEVAALESISFDSLGKAFADPWQLQELGTRRLVQIDAIGNAEPALQFQRARAPA